MTSDDPLKFERSATPETLRGLADDVRDNCFCPGDPGYCEPGNADWRFVEDYPLDALRGYMEASGEGRWEQWFRSEIDDLLESPDEPGVVARINAYRSFIEEGIDEAVILLERDGKPHIWDGHHRIGAAFTAGRATIPAIVGEPEPGVTPVHDLVCEAVRGTLNSWTRGIEYHVGSAQEINSGLCETFAHEAVQSVPEGFRAMVHEIGIEEVIDPDRRGFLWGPGVMPPEGNDESEMDALFETLLAGHAWIMAGDSATRMRHFDAECPEGVESFLDLPLFRRIRQGAEPGPTP